MAFIAASVGEKGRNLPGDTVTVQRLLNSVASSKGGASVPLALDGLVGPRTIGAIRTFQLKQFGPALSDGRVDPNGRTLSKLNELSGGGASSGRVIVCHPAPAAARATGGGLIGAPPILGLTRSVVSALVASVAPAASGTSAGTSGGASPLAAARVSLPEAVRWVTFALGKLEFIRLNLSTASATIGPIEQGILSALDTHFHVGFSSRADRDNLNQTRNRIGRLIIAYRSIATVFAQQDKFFAEDPGNTTDFANATLGGLTSGGKILFCPAYLTLGPKFRVAVIVHESAHFSDASIGHFASELPAPNGSPVGSPKNYVQLNFDEASRNAYSYAQFALHMVENFDHRLSFPRD